VILRATLAVIFIWHGLDKLTSTDSQWGANWAERLWQQSGKVPPDVLTKLNKLPTRSWLTEKEAEAEMTDEEVEALAEQRYKVATTRLQHAYAADAAPVPAMFSNVVQYVVTWGELLGGAALILGLLTRLAALGLLVIQLGAIYFVTSPLGLSPAQGVGYEFNLCLVAMCLALVILGGGGWSVDHCLWGRKAPEQSATSSTGQVAS
jgi:uncharacterized membrane protein YphA (DoxX/SURF4 family)